MGCLGWAASDGLPGIAARLAGPHTKSLASPSQRMRLARAEQGEVAAGRACDAACSASRQRRSLSSAAAWLASASLQPGCSWEARS